MYIIIICEDELADDVSWRCSGLIVGSPALHQSIAVRLIKGVQTILKMVVGLLASLKSLLPALSRVLYSQYACVCGCLCLCLCVCGHT